MTTPAITARLGGKPVIGACTWQLSSGVDPYISEFDLTVQDAEELLAGGLRPVDLKINAGPNGAQTFSSLYVLQRAGSPNPNHARVVVTDRRWFWKHAIVFGRFNIRRRIGTRRIEQSAIPELQPFVDDFAYAPWSTRTGTGKASDGWTARQVIEQVMSQAFSAEESLSVDRPEVGFSSWNGIDQIPIENLELDGSAADCIRRMLAYVPEASVTVLNTGKVLIYNRTSGDEDANTRAIVEVQGRGHLEEVDLRRIRPREIHIYFDREVELRFDSIAEGDSTTTDRSPEDQRSMQNVVPIPDYSLEVGGKTLTQGTYITMSEAFSAWGVMPRINKPLSDEFCRKAFVPGINLMTAIGEHGKREPDADWVSRVASVSQNWRQTYRINPRWMDRIRTIRAYRVAMVDPTTGQRAEAQSWTNYCTISSMRTLYLNQKQNVAGGGNNDGSVLPYATNVIGYPSSDFSTELPASPFGVRVIDDEQGIIRFDHITDPLRLRQIVLPGLMELEGDNNILGVKPSRPGPTANLKLAGEYPIAFNLLTPGQKLPMLTQTHKVATVLTALMGSPNGKSQLQRLVVKPQDVEEFVPDAVKQYLAESDGPIMEIRIGAAVETARVAWFQEWADRIEKAFGIGVPPEKQGEYVELAAITTNLGQNDDGASLWNIARAQAASIYSALGNRVQGSAVGGFLPTARVGGFLDKVHHRVGNDGTVLTGAELPRRIEPIDMAAYLDANTFRIVKRMVGSGGQGS